ncbi:hypothetical protein FSPOR_10690 [Fusarium sporotrichioides]|uniref:2EXR domain-containing protein n=1 Tax=Fusarium sporotrichioides TaxID=5514 RepID=A0A395RJQ6_FUSSP|nr:hypothetical protein FSPOR_10690 [Fusarium sporotrichioides]
MTAPTLDSEAQARISDRHTSSPDSPIQTIETPLKFEIPEDCRTFSPFARLPPEIRTQIWQSTLDTPGMHFLKIDTDWHPSTGIGRWWTKESTLLHMSSDEDDEDGDPMALEVKRERRPTHKVDGTLKPLYPTSQADISYYTNLHKQLAKLSVTCNEAAVVAKSLVKRSTAFRLDTGRLVSLNSFSDVIYLDYIPPDFYEDSIRFTRALNCSGLDQIRKVAMRYCHKWHDRKSPLRCPNCGQIHDLPDRLRYPRHLYRFLAQYLPNLEEFYFVDYLILRKSPGTPTENHTNTQGSSNAQSAGKSRTSRFEGGNRSFFEVDEPNWKITSHVVEIKSWLQEQFVKYAKLSKLSKHKNPELVKFGVLACEWRVEPPATPKKAYVTPVKKGRNKRAHSEEHSLSRARQISPYQRPIPPIEYLPYDATVRYSFVFDACGSNKYDFTFSMSL